MTPPKEVVLGVGITSSVGMSALETAAAVRAGTVRFAESPFLDRAFTPFTAAMVPNKGLPPLADDGALRRWPSRERRILRLTSRALHDCAAVLRPKALRPPLLLALPEQRTRSFEARALLAALDAQVPGSFDLAHSEGHAIGRAGGILVLARALDWIRTGFAPLVLVGGVDTFIDPRVLADLDLEGRVKTAYNLDGFIPGEGAAMLLLGSREYSTGYRLSPLASVSEVGMGAEPGHLYSEQPYRGDGLASAVRGAVAGASWGPVAHVYSSMNGENHWAKEWGTAYLRNRAAFDQSFALHHPADCFGDMGAASGATLLGLAALGISHGYRRGPCLVYASSDREARAAVVMGSAAPNSTEI